MFFHIMQYKDGWMFYCDRSEGLYFNENSLRVEQETKLANGDIIVLKKNTSGNVTIQGVDLFCYGRCPHCGAFVTKPHNATSFIEELVKKGGKK